MTRYLRAVFALLLMVLPQTLYGQEVGLPVGTTVQPVVMETLDGADEDLSAYIGSQPVFIQFWATWCEQCKALEPKVVAAYEEFGDRVKFVAVAVAVNQSRRSVRRHLEQHDLPFDFLWDARGRGVRAFRAPTTSYVVVLDQSGSVVYTGVGVDQEFNEVLSTVTGTS